MIKRLLTIFTLFVGINTFAQIAYQLQNVPTTITGDTSDVYLQGNVHIKNISASAKSIDVKVTEISIIPGTENNFCFGPACYPPGVYESIDPAVIFAGATDSSFLADYTPHGNAGVSQLKYKFWDRNNPVDSISIFINFDVQIVGVNKIPTKITQFNLSPNPANGMFVLSYSLNETVNSKAIIRNMLGSIVYEFNINDKQAISVVNTSSLESGIYFVSIVADNNVLSTKRLVVSH